MPGVILSKLTGLHDIVRLGLSATSSRTIFQNLRAVFCAGYILQEPMAQDKLVYVVGGAVFDVAVDVRVNSPNFGNWVGLELSSENARQLFIPKGFAHGFFVLSDTVLFAYKCSNVYSAENELTISWNDPDIGVVWPNPNPNLSERDKCGENLRDIAPTRLPQFSG